MKEDYDMTFKLKKSTCPFCGSHLDSAMAASPDTIARNGAPRSGDVSVCFVCGELSRFDDDMCMVPVPLEELQALIAEYPELNTIHKLIIASKQRSI